jgi:predicted nucleic-acid-binding Zn-ribbon protein
MLAKLDQPEGGPMQQWVLGCPKCREEFTQSDVTVPYHGNLEIAWPPKPEFPEGGMRMQCPNCGNISVYQRFQLTLYEALEKTGRAISNLLSAGSEA